MTPALARVLVRQFRAREKALVDSIERDREMMQKYLDANREAERDGFGKNLFGNYVASYRASVTRDERELSELRAAIRELGGKPGRRRKC